MLVELLYDRLESHKLHHCVGHLPAPQGGQALVQAVDTFILQDLVEAGDEVSRELTCVAGLDTDLNGLEGAQGTVSDDFGAGGGNGPADLFILDTVLFTYDALVDILEHFVEAELSHALGTVAQQGRCEPKGHACHPFLGHQHLNPLHHVRVSLRLTHLIPAFHNVHRGHTCMSQTTCQRST